MQTQFGTGRERGEDGRLVAKTAVREAVDEMDTDRVDFCQVFCSTKYDYEAALDGVREVVGEDAELFGCSSSGEFTEDGVKAGSVTVGVVASDTLEFFTSLSTGLSEDTHECVFEAVSDLPREGDPAVEGYPHRAAINLHDGLSGIGNKVARYSKQYLDDDVKLAGGAAGDDLKLEATHVFCNGEIESDAVGMALVASEKPIPMTVNHGHDPISEPMTVTDADGSTVHELDGKPAFDAWKDAVRESAARTYDVDVDELADDSDDLSKMLTRYEFGIETEPDRDDDEGGLIDRIRRFITRQVVSTSGYNIRWPGLTTTTDGPLEFAVEIPEGTELRVMHSAPDDQIASVRAAARNAAESTNGTRIAGGFVYDCVCRGAILENEFDRALDAISDEIEAPFAGFETYGEICSEDEEYTSYHNTTSVVMLLPA